MGLRADCNGDPQCVAFLTKEPKSQEEDARGGLLVKNENISSYKGTTC